MRRTVLYISMSLDGCLARPDGDVSWLAGQDPDDPDPFDFDPKDTKTTWEFTAGVTSKSIFDHPDFKPMFQNNPDRRKAY